MTDKYFSFFIICINLKLRVTIIIVYNHHSVEKRGAPLANTTFRINNLVPRRAIKAI